MVAPLAAPTQDGPESNVGSGFLVQSDGQIYLATVAHLATGQPSQTDDWSLWADEITLHNEQQATLARVPLFDVNDDGVKVPRFKYGRSTDTPGVLADVILLPLSPDEPMSSMSDIFHLPGAIAPYGQGDTVTIVGRRPWPALNAETHTLTEVFFELLLCHPEGLKGDSGGPVVSSSGLLVGMNFGGDNPNYPGHGLLIPVGLIDVLTKAVDGFITGWSYSPSVNQTRPRP